MTGHTLLLSLCPINTDLLMEIFQSVLDWYMANLNYVTVALLMLIESTFLPMPSEVVVPFAAYKASPG